MPVGPNDRPFLVRLVHGTGQVLDLGDADIIEKQLPLSRRHMKRRVGCKGRVPWPSYSEGDGTDKNHHESMVNLLHFGRLALT